jgi:hypothetical protein
MSAAIYTAIFGNYETLKQPVAQSEPCDFICFTDSRIRAREGLWQVIHVPRDSTVHSRMQAKWFKLLSHEIFPNGRLASRYGLSGSQPAFDLSIWIDGSVEIKSSTFVQDMRATLGAHDWAVFVHPDRDCIYEEAILSARLLKYRDHPVLAQVEAYRSTIPAHSGLYACTVIVRREPESPGVKRANELWWEENLKWTYQDQLSFPYVLKKTDTTVGIIGDCLWNNRWFKVGWYENDTRPHI